MSDNLSVKLAGHLVRSGVPADAVVVRRERWARRIADFDLAQANLVAKMT